MLIASMVMAAALASAAEIPDCLIAPADPSRDQASIDDVLTCQQDARDAWHALNPPPTASEWARLGERQKAEVKAYVARHPVDSKGKAARLGGISKKDLGRVPPGTAAALQELEADLQDESDGGKKGIDARMGKEIVDFLSQQQGGVSPEMTALLEAVEADGSKLTRATMLKLQQAARAVKAEGLDLGIDPKTEKDLLDTDLSRPDAEPPAAASPDVL